MSTTMVRYTVKPDQAARNKELVRRVYEELHETAPPGLRYATFVQEDGLGFVHVAEFAAEDGRNRLQEVAAFRAFQEGIADRCAEPPLAIGLREVGSYRAGG